MYPVVIMRAGASAPVMNYSTLAEDLASHGYIVVGFDAPYRTSVVIFPDRRVITRRPENNPELFSGEALAGLASRLLAAWTGGHVATGLGTGVIDFVLSPVFLEQGPPDIVAKAKAAWPQIEKAKSAILAGSLKVPFNTTL